MLTNAEKVGTHVGQRIRERRVQLGLKQAQIAATLEISYQQFQKYETGMKRVSAGRLFEIAQALHCPVAWFFEDYATDITLSPLPHGGANRATVELVRNFNKIEDPRLKAAIQSLVKEIA
ncbi:MAG: helix-turn-helix transcriptional regulator, partial [Sneathiella sp.]